MLRCLNFGKKFARWRRTAFLGRREANTAYDGLGRPSYESSPFGYCVTKIVLPLLLLFVSGCGGGSSSVSSYQPKGTTAKAALTSALDEWKSGRAKPGKIEKGSPVIEVQDGVWDSGRKLKGFQIGDEKSLADQPARFQVKLTFDGTPASEDAEYVVFGKDPLWVFRDKDYDKMGGTGAP